MRPAHRGSAPHAQGRSTAALALARAPLLLAAALLGSGCTLIVTFDPDDLEESSPDRCADGVDNDENGLTDCAEPGCQVFAFCQELTLEACRDRVDNDRDGLVDCEDPDCHEFEACNESLQGACGDGLDNNGDGLTDCADFTCAQDPRCCHRAVPLFADLIAPGWESCVVAPCVESSVGSQCNAFDPGRWESFGVPAPRATSSGFDPNRCEDCLSSGRCPPCRDAVLLSVDRYLLKPGLAVGAALRVGDGPQDRAGVALTWQSTVEETGSCPSEEPALDRLLGVSLETTGASPLSYRVRFLVDRVTERELPWPAPEVAAFLRVDDEGFAQFHLSEHLEGFPDVDAPARHRSLRALPASLMPLRIALHGNGSGPRVTQVRVQDGGRCDDPVPAQRVGLGDGVVFAAGRTGDASTAPDGEAWDAEVVSDPAVVPWQGGLHLFYTGRPNVAAAGAVGHALWGGDEVGFVRTGEGPLVDEAWVRQHATSSLAPELDVTGPAVLVRQEDDALLLYFGVAEREDDEIGRAWIGGAILTWEGELQPLVRTTPAGILTHELLSPKQGVTPSWERGVAHPAVVQRGPADYVMLYTGRSDPVDPFTAAIGLAVSADGVHWRRDNVLPLGDAAGENEPVMEPPEDADRKTGISSPTLVWDGDLEVFRVWFIHRVGAEFGLHHAVSGPQARLFRPFPGNPVLRPASDTWCDDRYLDGPSAWMEPSGLLRIWYHGRSETRGHSICYSENAFGQ